MVFWGGRYIHSFLKVTLGYTGYRLSTESLPNLTGSRLLNRRGYTIFPLLYSLPGKSLREFAGCQQEDHRRIKRRVRFDDIWLVVEYIQYAINASVGIYPSVRIS